VSVAASWRVRALAVVLALALGTAVAVGAGWPSRPASGAAGVQAPGPAVPDLPAQRAREVHALLAGRARAVLAHDRAAFLVGVDPRAPAFRARQAALFDALAQVPLRAWAYTVDAGRTQPPDAVLDARYGTWWGPRVVLRVALEGVDDDPAESEQALTFVQRSGRWYLAADDDFSARGSATAREVWDGGPVTVVRGTHSLVLGHPGSLVEMHRLAEDVDAAVPRVTAVWGPGWTQRVAVVVPADEAELGRLVTATGGLESLAAVTVAGPVRGGTARGADRVVVSPAKLALLSPAGRQVVLTHEAMHVATRAATTRSTPRWLSEGLADHVGYLGTGVPVGLAAQELRDDVRAGRLPAALPADADFRGDNPQVSSAYEQAWLAVELLVGTYGQDRVLALYRDVGARPGEDPAGALEQALRIQLGIGVAELTTAWRVFLGGQLA